jgi:hypothetical protein
VAFAGPQGSAAYTGREIRPSRAHDWTGFCHCQSPRPFPMVHVVYLWGKLSWQGSLGGKPEDADGSPGGQIRPWVTGPSPRCALRRDSWISIQPIDVHLGKGASASRSHDRPSAHLNSRSLGTPHPGTSPTSGPVLPPGGRDAKGKHSIGRTPHSSGWRARKPERQDGGAICCVILPRGLLARLAKTGMPRRFQ